ncbi:uncharacterized protein LOC130560562 isoform X2 [Triplophysa rosa]|nr:uncharacterized protein LOC130560562 isoform X2 [Triplophysa rosa]
MTKRKFRRCPACQVENQAIRKCCSSCYASLSKSKKMEALKDRLDNEWGQGVWKNWNAARVVSSAQIAVQKLASLGYMPILFMGRKKNNPLIADISAGMPLNDDTRPFIDTMKKAYEYLLKKQGPQMSQTQPDQQIQSPTQSDQQIQTLTQQIQTPTQPDQQIQTQPDQQIQTPIQQIQTPTQPDQQIQTQPDWQIQTQPDWQIQTPTQPDRQIQTQPEAQQIDDGVVLNLYFLPSPPHPQTHPEAQQLQVQPQPQQIQPLTAKPNPKKRKKGCRKCSRQKVWQYDSIIDKRMTEDKAEVKVRWLPCSHCGKAWEDTWEPPASS